MKSNTIDDIFGLCRIDVVPKNVRDVRDLLIYFDILGFTEDLAIIHAQLTVDLDNRGKPNGILDPLIASIVLSAVESIITRNVDHF